MKKRKEKNIVPRVVICNLNHCFNLILVIIENSSKDQYTTPIFFFSTLIRGGRTLDITHKVISCVLIN